MKTQDKIYVPMIDMGVEEGGDSMVPLWWNSNKLAEHPELKGVVEYVRKDAIIKLLEPETQTPFPDDYEKGWVDGRNDLIEELIDKIDSL